MKKRKGQDPEQLAVLALTALELAELARVYAEQRALRAELRLAWAERSGFLSRVDPAGTLYKLDADIAAKTDEGRGVQAREVTIRTGIEARIGVDLSRYSYDDNTGTLHELPKEE
jgi:hypothetical protein